MQVRAVELGWVNDVVIEVLSSFEDAPGTLIREDPLVEQRNKVRGLAHDRNVAKVTLVDVPDRPGVARAIFEPLAEAGINVDMIVQNVGHGGATDLSFTVPRVELAQGEEGPRAGRPRARRPRADDRRLGRQGLDRRRRAAQRPGLRGADVRDARRRRREHRDDLDLGGPDHLHHRRGRAGDRAARPPRRVRARAPRTGRRRAAAGLRRAGRDDAGVPRPARERFAERRLDERRRPRLAGRRHAEVCLADRRRADGRPRPRGPDLGRAARGRAAAARSGSGRPGCAPDRVWRLAAIASLAMAEAAEEVAGLPAATVRLKWPNDLVVDGGDGDAPQAGRRARRDRRPRHGRPAGRRRHRHQRRLAGRRLPAGARRRDDVAARGCRRPAGRSRRPARTAFVERLEPASRRSARRASTRGWADRQLDDRAASSSCVRPGRHERAGARPRRRPGRSGALLVADPTARRRARAVVGRRDPPRPPRPDGRGVTRWPVRHLEGETGGGGRSALARRPSRSRPPARGGGAGATRRSSTPSIGGTWPRCTATRSTSSATITRPRTPPNGRSWRRSPNLPRFEERARPADGEGASTFRVWLFRIARNVVAERRRRRRRRPEAPLERRRRARRPARPRGGRRAAATRPRRRWRAVEPAAGDRRRAVVLRFVDEMSTAEIAGVLGPLRGRGPRAHPPGAAERRPRPRRAMRE